MSINATTSRIPGLGDLPYIGVMFSNTTHERQEKELLVMVTPFLASPMNPGEVPPLPGEDIKDPNDLDSTCSIASKDGPAVACPRRGRGMILGDVYEGEISKNVMFPDRWVTRSNPGPIGRVAIGDPLPV